jgi:hypothetical protein
MNQRRNACTLLVLLSLVLIVLVGCGGGDEQTTTTTLAATAGAGAAPAVQTATTTTVLITGDVLSTFESKDPFIQRVSEKTVSQSTSATTVPGQTTTTAASQVSTYLHNLKVLSIDVANGTAVVTFQVDGVVYQDKNVGDTTSTAWGQVKVVSISSETQTVVLLHGSETRTLQVGQEFFK